MYKDSNCTQCRHEEVCGIKNDYIEFLVKVREVVDTKLDRYGVSIICDHFDGTPHVRGNLPSER